MVKKDPTGGSVLDLRRFRADIQTEPANKLGGMPVAQAFVSVAGRTCRCNQETLAMPYDDRRVVLLIGDDLDTLELLEQTFVQADMRYLEATDIEQVVSAMQQEMPDIVVCDESVGNVNREELQQRMPDNLELKNLPFVFLYSSGPAREKHQYLSLDQYFHKPFTPIALVSMVEQMLAQKGSLAELSQASGQRTLAGTKALRQEVFRELKRIERYGGNLSICVFDIVKHGADRSVGATIEPMILSQAIEELPGLIRDTDFLARLSRRRFLWLMPETSADAAEMAVQRFMAAFAHLPNIHIHVDLAIRAGLATAPEDGLSYEELVGLAEQELDEQPTELGAGTKK